MSRSSRHGLHSLLGILLLAIVITVGSVVASRGQQNYGEFYQQNRGLSFADLKAKGRAYLDAQEFDSAIACYLMMTSRYDERLPQRDRELCADAYNNLGYIYSFLRTDYSLAYGYLLECIRISRQMDYQRILPYVYINIGNIYGYYDDFANALSYYRQASRQAIDVKEWDGYLVAMGNSASYLQSLHQIDTVRSLRRELDSLDIPARPMLGCTRMQYEALLTYLSGHLDEAVALLLASCDSINSPQSPERFLQGTYDMIAQCYHDSGRYPEAIGYLQRADSLALLCGSADHLYNLQSLSAAYDSLGDREQALACQLQYIALRDSILREQQYASIRDMQSGFELKGFEQTLHEEHLRHRTQLTMTIVVSLFALVLLVLLVDLIRRKRRLEESFSALYQKNQQIEQLEAEKVEAAKYKGSALGDELKQRLVDRVLEALSTTAVIADPDLTVSRLAELVESNEKYVSQTINEELGKNFSSLLAEYRIREVQRRLQDPDTYGHLTLEAVAQATGFKSRSTFSTTFKKITGLTPSEYQHQLQSVVKK